MHAALGARTNVVVASVSISSVGMKSREDVYVAYFTVNLMPVLLLKAIAACTSAAFSISICHKLSVDTLQEPHSDKHSMKPAIPESKWHWRAPNSSTSWLGPARTFGSVYEQGTRSLAVADLVSVRHALQRATGGLTFMYNDQTSVFLVVFWYWFHTSVHSP